MRTLNEIKQAIRADFMANFALTEAYGLDTSKTFDEQFSAVSIEAIWTFIVALAIFLMESIFDTEKAALEARIAAEYPFSFSWYYNKALAFQLGDLLIFDETTYKFAYPVVDETKQIVDFVAIRQREVDGVTKLQVYAAKEGKEALTVDEKAAFEAYVRQIGAAGTHFEFISLAPDQIDLELVVTYNPQILDGTGTRLSGSGKPVEEAISAYLDGIKYSGAFSRTKLVDAIQQADGVFDVVLGDVYLNDVLTNTQTFESDSGFYAADEIGVTYTAGYDY